MIRFSPTKYLYKIQTTYNKHFIRQYICQNKVLIPLKIYSHLHRQTIFDTNRPIPNSCIRILRLPPKRPGSLPQVRLHLLPIQKHIISPYNPRWCQVVATIFLNFFVPISLENSLAGVTLLLFLPRRELHCCCIYRGVELHYCHGLMEYL